MLLGSLDEDEAFIYKTTVIVKRDYKEFYFITKAINILNTKEKYTVKSFLIDNDRVVGKISEKKIETRSDEYGENDLKKVLLKLGKIEEC